MGLPNIIINFKSSGTTAVKRGERGVVALILKDAACNGFNTYSSVSEIPSELNLVNKEYIGRAFLGGISVPKKVAVYVLPADSTDYVEALTYLETVAFDYLCCPPDTTEALATVVATWTKSQREAFDKKIKVVLPSIAANHEGIVNFDTSSIKVGTTTFTTAQYCSRIAGLLAGTPLSVSATFTELMEVTDVPRLTKTQLDAAIDAGKFVIFHDGEKVKVARAINSLTTTSAEKGSDFKKCKIIDILDLIHNDIKRTANDGYVGKYPNSYDNKCILITAIQGYYESLEADSLLEAGKNTIGVDVAAQENYLKSKGINTAEMTAQELKEANTNDKVFLASTLSVLDAIEDITLGITV